MDIDDPRDRFIFYFIIMFAIIGIAELALIGYSFIMADDVSCNWLYCTATKTQSHTQISQECFMNGNPINCSEVMRWD